MTNMYSLKFKINGFHCSACVKLATMKLRKIEGVESVSVLQDGKVELVAKREIPMSEIAVAVEALGYTLEKN